MSSPLDDDNEEISVDYYLTHYVPLFEKLRWEIQDTEDWIKRFLLEKNTSMPPEISSAMEVASRYSSTEPPAWTETLDTRKKSDLDTSKNYRSRKAYWHLNRVEEMEKALDTLRQWIVNNFKIEESESKPLILSFEREKKLHEVYRAKHRK